MCVCVCVCVCVCASVVALWSLLQNQLKPDIPEDVAIHFHISATMLVLTILSIVPLSRQQAAVPKQPIGSSSWLGATLYVMTHNDFNIMITAVICCVCVCEQ